MNEIIKLLLENEELFLPIVQQYIEKYKPLVYSLLNEVHDIYKDYANNDDWFKTSASVKRKIYLSYVNAGFTEDQAMALMINDNIQLMNAVKQSAARNKTNK